MMLLVLRTLVKAGMLLGSKSRAEHVQGTKFYLQNQKKGYRGGRDGEGGGGRRRERKRANYHYSPSYLEAVNESSWKGPCFIWTLLQGN